jgi:hypothetical protein
MNDSWKHDLLKGHEASELFFYRFIAWNLLPFQPLFVWAGNESEGKVLRVFSSGRWLTRNGR